MHEKRQESTLRDLDLHPAPPLKLCGLRHISWLPLALVVLSVKVCFFFAKKQQSRESNQNGDTTYKIRRTTAHIVTFILTARDMRVEPPFLQKHHLLLSNLTL